MMYVPTPEAVWSHMVSEWLTWGTLGYALGVGAVFVIIIVILEFLDSTRGSGK